MCCQALRSRRRSQWSRVRDAPTGASSATGPRQTPRGGIRGAGRLLRWGKQMQGPRKRGPAVTLQQGCRCSEAQGSGGEQGSGAPASTAGCCDRVRATSAVVLGMSYRWLPRVEGRRWSLGYPYSLLQLAYGDKVKAAAETEACKSCKPVPCLQTSGVRMLGVLAGMLSGVASCAVSVCEWYGVMPLWYALVA